MLQKRVEVNDLSRGQYSVDINIRSCNVTATNIGNKRNKKLIFKNNAPFIDHA